MWTGDGLALVALDELGLEQEVVAVAHAVDQGHVLLDEAGDDDLAEQGLPVDLVQPEHVLVDERADRFAGGASVDLAHAAAPADDAAFGVGGDQGHGLDLAQVGLQAPGTLQLGLELLDLVAQAALGLGARDVGRVLPLLALLLVALEHLVPLGLGALLGGEDIAAELLLQRRPLGVGLALHLGDGVAVGLLQGGTLLHPLLRGFAELVLGGVLGLVQLGPQGRDAAGEAARVGVDLLGSVLGREAVLLGGGDQLLGGGGLRFGGGGPGARLLGVLAGGVGGVLGLVQLRLGGGHIDVGDGAGLLGRGDRFGGRGLGGGELGLEGLGLGLQLLDPGPGLGSLDRGFGGLGLGGGEIGRGHRLRFGRGQLRLGGLEGLLGGLRPGFGGIGALAGVEGDVLGFGDLALGVGADRLQRLQRRLGRGQLIADVGRFGLRQRDLNRGRVGVILDALGGLRGGALQRLEHLFELAHAGPGLGRFARGGLRLDGELFDQLVPLRQLRAHFVQHLADVVGGGLGLVQLGAEIGLGAGIREQGQSCQGVAPVAVEPELVEDDDAAPAALLLQLDLTRVGALGVDRAVHGSADELALAAEVQVPQGLGLHLVFGPPQDAGGAAAPGEDVPRRIGEDHALLEVLQGLLEQRDPLLQVAAGGDVDADGDVADRGAAADAEAGGRPRDGALGAVLDRRDQFSVADVLVADPAVVDVLHEPAVVRRRVEPLQQPADVAAVRRVVPGGLAQRPVEQDDLEVEVRDVDEERRLLEEDPDDRFGIGGVSTAAAGGPWGQEDGLRLHADAGLSTRGDGRGPLIQPDEPRGDCRILSIRLSPRAREDSAHTVIRRREYAVFGNEAVDEAAGGDVEGRVASAGGGGTRPHPPEGAVIVDAPGVVNLVAAALFDRDVRARGAVRIDRGGGQRDVEGDAEVAGDDGVPEGADLVRHIAVAGDPVRAGDDRLDLPVGGEVPKGVVGDDDVVDPFAAQLPGGEARSLSPRAGLVDEDLQRLARPRGGIDRRQR